MKLTQEQEKDIEKRLEDFMKDYTDLTKKYQINFYSFPQFVPDKDGTFKISVITQPGDTKYRSIPSPLQ